MATVEKRLQADGTVSFRAKIRIKGALPQTASFARLTDARKWAQSAEAAIREGRHFGYQETKRHTVTDLIERYARDVLRQDSPDVENRKRQLAWWKGKIGHLTLADVTPALIAEHRDKLLKEPIVSQAKNPDPKKPVRYRSNSTVVRYLAAISHAFTIAIKEWQWLENNPVQRIRKPKEARGRDRFLSDEEPYSPGDYPISMDSCDWRFERRGRPPVFDKYVCHAACHWIVNSLLRTAATAYPKRPWIIVSSDDHSTVWDQDETFFDMNFLALGVTPKECAELTVFNPASYFLERGQLLHIY